MVTPLDLGLFKHFGAGLFPFLLVLVLGYALFSKVVFKERPGIAAMLALLLAIVTVMSDTAVKTINTMSPWFVLFVIFGSFILIAFMSLGISEAKVTEILTSSEYGTTFSNWVIAIMLIIGIGSLVAVINEEKPIVELQAGADGNITTVTDSSGGFWPTLFHPKVLGLILILLISYFTINYLTKKD